MLAPGEEDDGIYPPFIAGPLAVGEVLDTGLVDYGLNAPRRVVVNNLTSVELTVRFLEGVVVSHVKCTSMNAVADGHCLILTLDVTDCDHAACVAVTHRERQEIVAVHADEN